MATTNQPALTPGGCAERAASLLERAERADTPGGRSSLVELAAGWRDLGVAISQILAARNG